MKKKIRVLYLDDEENNLRSFKAAFRRDFQVYTAQNTEEAFAIVKEHQPHVVFSDQRMPVTTGVEFFNALRQVYPDSVRILITGYADMDNVIQAINKGNVYRYLTKPWSEDEIKIAILNGYDLFQARRDLKDKMEKLQKTNDDLNRFVYSTSHDLRSPLVSVMGLVELAQTELEDKKALEYMDMIYESVQRMDSFIHNIIEYYRNTRDVSTLDKVDINELVEEVVKDLKAYVQLKKVKLNISVDQPEDFFTDRFRLRIVLSNLLSNAIKFQRPENENPEVTIQAKVGDGRAHIIVKDNGMGIVKEHLEQVFNMFFRGTAQVGGTGIGLYIVKEALEKIKGSIRVDSTPGEGTQFSIDLLDLAQFTQEEDD